MSLRELKKEASQLSVSDRLELLKSIIDSIESELRPRPNLEGIIERMRGLAKTDSQNRKAVIQSY